MKKRYLASLLAAPVSAFAAVPTYLTAGIDDAKTQIMDVIAYVAPVIVGIAVAWMLIRWSVKAVKSLK